MKLGFGWGLVAGIAAYWAYQHFTGGGQTGKAKAGKRSYG